jgi:hypothetical protein
VASVVMFEGVPGRNGTVTELSTSATTTITPEPGEHFYYARVTQEDGAMLWSAPVWVTQSGSSDTIVPAVSAGASGTSGAITLSSTASDNVGVTHVEFYVDAILKGSDAAAPYAMTLDSTTLANGRHSLTAKAYDAAGNVGTSGAASFSISNGATQLIVNGGFESGKSSWSASNGVITDGTVQAAHGGSWKAWLNGYGDARTDTMYQQRAIPSAATAVTLAFWLRVDSSETTTTTAKDTLKVQVRSSSGALLATLATYSNLDKGTTYLQKSFDLTAYKGQTVRIYFEGIEGSTVQTSFVIDDVSLTVL